MGQQSDWFVPERSVNIVLSYYDEKYNSFGGF